MAEERKDEFLGRLWDAYTAFIAGERKRVSQSAIAKAIAEGSRCPTRQDDVSRWLRGIGRPSYEELPATAKALRVRRDWLAFNEGPMEDGKALAPRYRSVDELPKKESAESRKSRRG